MGSFFFAPAPFFLKKGVEKGLPRLGWRPSRDPPFENGVQRKWPFGGGHSSPQKGLRAPTRAKKKGFLPGGPPGGGFPPKPPPRSRDALRSKTGKTQEVGGERGKSPWGQIPGFSPKVGPKKGGHLMMVMMIGVFPEKGAPFSRGGACAPSRPP